MLQKNKLLLSTGLCIYRKLKGTSTVSLLMPFG